MATRLIPYDDLIGKFKIDRKLVDEYFKEKVENDISLINNFPSHTSQLMRSYTIGLDSFSKKLDELHTDILSKIDNEISVNSWPKSYPDEDMARSIFSDVFEPKVALIAARESLERVKEKFTKINNLYNTSYYEGEVYFYSTLLFDAHMLFGKCGRRSLQSPDMEIFQFSKNLLRNYIYYNTPTIPTTIILLRQCIETKILQTIGVDRFEYDDGSQAIIGVNKLLDFCIDQEKRKLIKAPIKFEFLSLINKWCNNYVHTGNFSHFVWEVEWAHHLLSPLFRGGSDRYTKISLEKSIHIDKLHHETHFQPELEKFLTGKSRKKVKVKMTKNKFLFF
ncbi:hypothetical protein [Cellvibrio sp. PSBB023]|uniref:hypothetical protein n=1 Tax=Cellvibrio sp. PSBB023 TaxID=1945512 RepID=UPI0009900AB8|nr:hypothetical protein [Cellvibrio sp. PSBB023]AQT62167.1 hypothetical protein B0D95_20165 [Cellvibrio sp. PSBB023]